MSQHQELDGQTDALGAERYPVTPPVSASPMPTQVIEYWTVAEASAALMRALLALSHLPAVLRAIFPASKPDEQAQ